MSGLKQDYKVSMPKQMMNEVVCGLLTVAVLFITSCPNTTISSSPENNAGPRSTPPAGTEGKIATFFLDDQRRPTTVDRGVTALTATGGDVNYPLVTSEESVSGYSVRLISLDPDISTSVVMDFGSLTIRFRFHVLWFGNLTA